MADYVPSDRIQDILANLPADPGVYQMLDPKGTILYGQGQELAAACAATSSRATTTPVLKIPRDGGHPVHFTGDELKALITEAELIRVHKPRYNVMLKDDKRYRTSA